MANYSGPGTDHYWWDEPGYKKPTAKPNSGARAWNWTKDHTTGLGDESESTTKKRNDLDYQGQEASGFANEGQDAYTGMRAEGAGIRDMLRKQATGETSLSSEQLRQGLQQNLAAQRSMQASASPGNAAMAARMASQNAAKLGYGMSGQAATAGIQEREAGARAYSDAYNQQRQQELEQALRSRQNAIAGFGGVTPEQSGLEKAAPWVGMATGGASSYWNRGK